MTPEFAERASSGNSSVVAVDFAQHLIDVEAAPRVEVEAALMQHINHAVPFLAALREVHADVEAVLEQELERMWGAREPARPVHTELLARLPEGMCARFLAYPVAMVGDVVEVVAVEPLDPHLNAEFTHHLQTDVRFTRASLSEVQRELAGLSTGPGPSTRRQDREHMNELPLSQQRADSVPPIPLVRRPPVSPSLTPGTRRGVAPGPDELSKAPPVRRAPVIVPRPQDLSAADSPGRKRAPTLTGEPLSPVANSTDLLHPGALRMSLASPNVDQFESVLGTLAVADDPDQVVEAIAKGMAPVTEELIVFAARGEGLSSRIRLDYAGQPERFVDLEVGNDTDSSAEAALRQGQVLRAPTPEDLLLFVGQPAEVCATRVQVHGRPALVFAAAGFSDSYEVTRRADRLARASADALARIIRARKR